MQRTYQYNLQITIDTGSDISPSLKLAAVWITCYQPKRLVSLI